MKKKMIKYETELDLRVNDIQNREMSLNNITKYRKSWKILQNRITFLSRLRRLITEARMFGLKMVNGDDDNPEEEEENRKNAKWVINPRGRWYQMHVLVLSLFITYIIIFLPISLAFEYEKPMENVWKILEVVSSVWILLDMLLAFFVPYHSGNKMVKDRKKIRVFYLRNYFVYDLFSLMPFYTITNVAFGSRLKVLKTFKFTKLLVTIKQMRSIEYKSKFIISRKILSIYKTNRLAGKIVSILAVTLLFTHISACFWASLLVAGDSQDNWIQQFKQNSDDVLEDTGARIYLLSFYWAISTISTVGLGDVNPSTGTETLFCIIFMIFGVWFYSSSIGTFSTLIGDQMSMEKNRLYNILGDLYNMNLIDKDLLQDLTDSVDIFFSSKTKKIDTKMALLKVIPEKERIHLLSQFYEGKMIRNTFFQKCDKEFIAQVAPKFDLLRVKSGDYVYTKDQPPINVYLIISGRVNCLHRRKTTMKSYVADSYFGEVEIFKNCPRMYTVRAEKLTELLVLKRDEFLSILDKFPEAKKNFLRRAILKTFNIKLCYLKNDRLSWLPRDSDFWIDTPSQTSSDNSDDEVSESRLHKDQKSGKKRRSQRMQSCSSYRSRYVDSKDIQSVKSHLKKERMLNSKNPFAYLKIDSNNSKNSKKKITKEKSRRKLESKEAKKAEDGPSITISKAQVPKPSNYKNMKRGDSSTSSLQNVKYLNDGMKQLMEKSSGNLIKKMKEMNDCYEKNLEKIQNFHQKIHEEVTSLKQQVESIKSFGEFSKQRGRLQKKLGDILSYFEVVEESSTDTIIEEEDENTSSDREVSKKIRFQNAQNGVKKFINDVNNNQVNNEGDLMVIDEKSPPSVSNQKKSHFSRYSLSKSGISRKFDMSQKKSNSPRFMVNSISSIKNGKLVNKEVRLSRLSSVSSNFQEKKELQLCSSSSSNIIKRLPKYNLKNGQKSLIRRTSPMVDPEILKKKLEEKLSEGGSICSKNMLNIKGKEKIIESIIFEGDNKNFKELSKQLSKLSFGSNKGLHRSMSKGKGNTVNITKTSKFRECKEKSANSLDDILKDRIDNDNFSQDDEEEEEKTLEKETSHKKYKKRGLSFNNVRSSVDYEDNLIEISKDKFRSNRTKKNKVHPIIDSYVT